MRRVELEPICIAHEGATQYNLANTGDVLKAIDLEDKKVLRFASYKLYVKNGLVLWEARFADCDRSIDKSGHQWSDGWADGLIRVQLGPDKIYMRAMALLSLIIQTHDGAPVPSIVRIWITTEDEPTFPRTHPGH